MFNSLNLVIAKLNPKDQQLFEQLSAYNEHQSKVDKLQCIINLFELDETQIILKYIARNSSCQVAFGFTLWLISNGLITLDWIYDMTYTISTSPSKHEIDLSHLFMNSRKLDSLDLLIVVPVAETNLQQIKLDELEINELVTRLPKDLAVSLLTWFINFHKITPVDLAHISEISQNLVKSQNEESSNQAVSSPGAEEKRLPIVQPEPSPIEPKSTNPFGSVTLEDLLIELNTRMGGTESEISTTTLNKFFFYKTLDSSTGREKVDFRPPLKVIQYLNDGQKRQESEMRISSTKTWSPGIYAVRKGDEELKIMRLPGHEYFEIFPEGPDPYLRALTIWSMLRQDSLS